MKFKDIKVGDIVYTDERVRIADNYAHSAVFKVPVTIEKVTKTQFTAARNRYQKKTGFMIGDARWPYIGNAYLSDEVEDESEKRDEALKFKRIISNLCNLENSIKNIGTNNIENLESEVIKIRDEMSALLVIIKDSLRT